ncbi:MAG TPA: hypothetical protein VKB52_16765 [Rhodanobacteraceae bacterium]|nr:hypothetical protein [Rhodanobacteraceae bacterium]
MNISSGQDSFAARGLAVLRSVGEWVAIRPEQTYVATSIRGLGTCKSTYCHAERRELPARQAGRGWRPAPLAAAAVAAVGFLSACADYRPRADLRDVTGRDQYEHDLADCQIFAAPVSPGVAAEALLSGGSDRSGAGALSAGAAHGRGLAREGKGSDGTDGFGVRNCMGAAATAS